MRQAPLFADALGYETQDAGNRFTHLSPEGRSVNGIWPHAHKFSYEKGISMEFDNSSRYWNSLFRHAAPLTALLLCAALAGCVTPSNVTSEAEQSKGALEALYVNADTELAHGDRETALALLKKAAKNDPENVEPWLKIAHVRFDAGEYPESILAANEVLQRDAVNQTAKSILVVAGLRIAAGAVNGLRESGAIATGERVQAQNLTNSLREILGEKVLVPASPPIAIDKPVARPVRKHVRPHRAANASAALKAPSASAGQASDPFKSLK